MSEAQIAILVSILAYFALMIWIGYRQSKLQDHKGFIIGAREVGYFATTGAIAASFRDGAGIVLWIGFAYSVGYGGMWVFIGALLGLSIFSILGSKVRELSIEKNYITVGQMIRHNIGKGAEVSSSVLVLIFSLLAMGIQLYVSGNIFATALNQPAYVGLIAVALIVLFYLWEGGYGSVIKTDIFQFILILSLVIIPFFMDIKKEDILNVGSIVSMGWRDSIALFLIGFFFAISMGDTWQRVFSAKSNKVVKIGFPMAGPALIFMTLTLIWIGFGLKSVVPDIENDKIIYAMFQQEALDTWMLCFLAVGFMGITMSTLDTSTYLFTATILKNFIPEKYTAERSQYVKVSKIIMVVSMLVMIFISLSIANVIQFLFSAASLLFVLGPVFVFSGFGWFKKSRMIDICVTTNIAICSGVYIYMFIMGMLEDMLLTTVPAGLSFIGCIITVILGKTVFKKTKANVKA